MPAKNEKNHQHYRPWSAEEEGYLKEHYPTTSTAALAKKLGRTNDAVFQRARILGLKRSFLKNIVWKDEEINFLKDNYRTMKKHDIANHLGKNHMLVYLKSVELGLVEKRGVDGLISCSATLDEESVWIAKQLGSGNISKGIRLALKFTASTKGIKP
jgi:hypothetical protein